MSRLFLCLLFILSLFVQTSATTNVNVQVDCDTFGYGNVVSGQVYTTSYAYSLTYGCQEYEYGNRAATPRCPDATGVDYYVPLLQFKLPNVEGEINSITFHAYVSYYYSSTTTTEKKLRIWSGGFTQGSDPDLVSKILNPDSQNFELYPLDDTLNSVGWHEITLCSSSTECAAIMELTDLGDSRVVLSYGQISNVYILTRISQAHLEINVDHDDTTPPAIDHVPYTGISSYKAGSRTLFMKLTDLSGIDTTYANRPRLHYRVGHSDEREASPGMGPWTEISTETIGECSSSSTECKFKATIPGCSIGDYVEYYWSFQDLVSPTPHVGYAPALSGSPPAAPYWFRIKYVTNAGDNLKFTVLLTDVSAYTQASPNRVFDRQMTYYEDNDEYVFEFDTSDCGTGSSSCFYTSSSSFYENWALKWTTSPSSGYQGFGGTLSGSQELREGDGGYLSSISAKDGPGTNLIFWYDSKSNKWGMVGLGDDTHIDAPLVGGTEATLSTTSGYTKAYIIPAPNDFQGTMGKFDFEGTYSSSRANWMCVTTNGVIYWFRSTSNSPSCTSYYYYFLSASYKWSGFALGTGYYGRQLDSGTVTFDVGKIAPLPDTYAPIVTASVPFPSEIVGDSATFTFSIRDEGEPPSGLDVATTIDEGPTLYYRIQPSTTWISSVLSPSGQTRQECKMSECQWSSIVKNLEPDDIVEYYVTAKDTSVVASGVNTKTTTISTVTVKNPEKMLVVEWHNIGYLRGCTIQLILYEGTSVFEYRYANDCEVYYDGAVVGFQDHTRTKGMTIRKENSYIYSQNPFTNNYQMNTQASGNGEYRTLDRGLEELKYYNEVLRGTGIRGTGNGPNGYHCSSNYYFPHYKDGCGANIDLPIDFEYFGQTYAASDSNQRLAISRFGAAYLTQSTALERTIFSTSTPPELPYISSSSAVRPGLMAVWWGAYSSYYMYADSYIAYNVLPVAGCPEGQAYKSEACGCVPDCPEGEGYEGDGCDCVTVCPTGYKKEESDCVPDVDYYNTHCMCDRHSALCQQLRDDYNKC